jgi:hypothetical protein
LRQERLLEEQGDVGGSGLERVETLRGTDRGRPEAEPRRTALRNVAVALTSVSVVALLVAYALAGPTPGLTLSVGHVVPQPGATAVVQGRAIQPDASGLRGMRVEVRRGGAIAAEGVSDRRGMFRVDLIGGCGVYEVTLQARWQGSALEGETRRRLCPGDALPLEARVVTQGHYFWVPGPR